MASAADFTIADVLAWARTKPADETYRYSSNTECALCQFLRETGRAKRPSVGGITWMPTAFRGAELPIPEDLHRPLQAGTFGGLVKSLEGLCPDTPVTRSDWAAIDAYLTDIEQVSA